MRSDNLSTTIQKKISGDTDAPRCAQIISIEGPTIVSNYLTVCAE